MRSKRYEILTEGYNAMKGVKNIVEQGLASASFHELASGYKIFIIFNLNLKRCEN